MGRYLREEEEKAVEFLQREGTNISKEDVKKLIWNDKVWLVVHYIGMHAGVCFHERELNYVKAYLNDCTADVKYYLVQPHKLEGKY